MTIVTSEFDGMDLRPMEPPVITARTIWHVGVSGGKDSAAALLWMVHESGIPRERIRASFSDIGNDHPWTIEHVKLLSEKVHPIETIRPELNFFDLCFSKRRFPSPKARFCTEHLKIVPTADHIQDLRVAGFDPISVAGTRGDESADRATLPEWDYSGTMLVYQWRPLIRWTLADVLAIHDRHNIPLNPLYALGAQRVGCWPCVMSRKEEIRIIALKNPERIDEIEKAELEFERRYGRFSSFFHAETVPPRFRSKRYVDKEGNVHMVCTIRDVVKWALTGHRAKGKWDDEPAKEVINCKSGFCE